MIDGGFVPLAFANLPMPAIVAATQAGGRGVDAMRLGQASRT
jgi:hypothetical protein